MRDQKVIVAVVRLRDCGKVVPKHNLAFVKPFVGVLTLDEQHVPALNRHALVATICIQILGRLYRASSR